METTGQKIRIRYITFLFIFFISSCFNSNEPRGAYWNGQANFMHVTKESMTMTYSVDITGQKVFLEGFYEVIKKNTGAYSKFHVFLLLFWNPKSTPDRAWGPPARTKN